LLVPLPQVPFHIPAIELVFSSASNFLIPVLPVDEDEGAVAVAF